MKDALADRAGPLLRVLQSSFQGLEPEAARSAVSAGRVFVDGRRITDPRQEVRSGARLRLHPERSRPELQLSLLFEDDELLVVDKPAGWAVNVSETSDRMSIAEHFADRDARVVHRLDLGTTGVLVLAKGPDVARALSAAFAARTVDKRYWAVVEGDGLSGVFDAPIGRDRRRPRARAVTRSGQAAETRVQTLGASGGLALVEAELITGRTHQIRVHVSHAGQPLLGDTLYGGPAAFRWHGEVLKPGRPLLHALTLQLPKPWSRVFEAPPPADLQPFVTRMAPTV